MGAKGHTFLSAVLGENRNEVRSLPAYVAKLAESQGYQKVVVLLDQNLEYEGGSLKGTDICRTLREDFSFRGLIFIQSCDDDAEDQQKYIAAGADACLSKGLKSLAAKLRKMTTTYHEKFSPQLTCGEP